MGVLLTALAAWLGPFLVSLGTWFASAAFRFAAGIAVGLVVITTLLGPVQSFFNSFASATSGFTGGVLWFLGVLQFPQGLVILGTAYSVRFCLRRFTISL